MNWKFIGVVLVLGLLLILVCGGLTYDVFTPKQKDALRAIGYVQTHEIHGISSYSFTYVSDGRMRVYMNCTSDRAIFNNLIVEINGREKILRTCNGRRRLIAFKQPGTYEFIITPLYIMNIGTNSAIDWEIEIWEKVI